MPRTSTSDGSFSGWVVALAAGVLLGCAPPPGMAILGPDAARSANLRGPGLADDEMDDSLAPAPRSPSGLPGVTWLFAVGISDYANDDLDLEFAARDAEAVVHFFSQETTIVAPERAIVLPRPDAQATRSRIMAELDRFLGRTGPDDLVILYLAMHGFSVGGVLHVLPYESEPWDAAGQTKPLAELRAMALDDEELARMTDKSASRHFVLIADTCHTVARGQEGMRGLVRPRVDPMMARVVQTKPGFAVITASSADQSSREGEQWGGHGVFTASLLDGLAGAADSLHGGDGLITVRELFEYTRREVGEKTEQRQHPELKGSFDASLPIARLQLEDGLPPVSAAEVPRPELGPDARARYRRAQQLFDARPCRAAAELRAVAATDPEWGPVHHDRGLSLERCGRFDQAAEAYREYQRFAQPRELERVRERVTVMAQRQTRLGMALWIPASVTAAISLATAALLMESSDAPWLATGNTRRAMLGSLAIGGAVVPGIAIGATYHARGANLRKYTDRVDSSSTDHTTLRPTGGRRISRVLAR